MTVPGAGPDRYAMEERKNLAHSDRDARATRQLDVEPLGRRQPSGGWWWKDEAPEWERGPGYLFTILGRMSR